MSEILLIGFSIKWILTSLRRSGIGILSTSSGFDIKSIFYYGDTCKIVYVFEADGVDISFEGELRKKGDFKGIKYGKKLESF